MHEESEACTCTSLLVATNRAVHILAQYEQGTFQWPLRMHCLSRMVTNFLVGGQKALQKMHVMRRAYLGVLVLYKIRRAWRAKPGVYIIPLFSICETSS